MANQKLTELRDAGQTQTAAGLASDDLFYTVDISLADNVASRSITYAELQTAFAGEWTDAGSYIHPTETADTVSIGSSTTSAGQLDVRPQNVDDIIAVLRGITSFTGNYLECQTVAGATQVSITSDDEGRVGIGTGSPLGALHINSTTAANDATTAIRFCRSDVLEGVIGVANTTNNIVSGTAAGDVAIRGETQSILLSTDKGVTADVKIASGGGAVTFAEAYTFPTADGSADQVLVTDGAGTLTFQDQSGSGGMAIGDAVTGGTAGSVLFVDASGNLGQDNANFFWNDTTNKLGVGTNNPGGKVSVIGDGTETILLDLDALANPYTGTGGFDAIRIDVKGQSVASDSTRDFRGIEASVTEDHDVNGGPLFGDNQITKGAAWDVRQTSIISATGGSSYSLSGSEYSITNQNLYTGAGTYTENDIALKAAVTVSANVNNAGATFTGTAIGIDVDVDATPALTSGTLTQNAYGLRIDVAGNTNGTSETRAIYLKGAASADTNWAIYSEPDVQSWHRGELAIGSESELTPSAQLHVDNGTAAADIFRCDDNGTEVFSIADGGAATFGDAFTFPTTDGSANQVLQTDGAGAVTWSNQAATIAIGSTITSGTVGSVLFVGTGPVIAQDNANFFWDDTNNRLGLGMNSPDAPLHILATSGPQAVFQTSDTSNPWIQIENSAGTATAGLGYNVSGDYAWFSYGTAGVLRMISSGATGIGRTNDLGVSNSLDIHGQTLRVGIGNAAWTTMALLAGSATGAFEYYGGASGGDFGILSQSTQASVGGGSGTTQFKIDGQAPANSFDIDSSGYAGINETSQGAQLHVTTSGTGVIGQRIKLTASQTADAFDIVTSADAELFAVDPSGAVTFANAFTFPTSDGSNTQVLTTNGSGTVSWTNQTGGSSEWTDASTYLYPTESSDNIMIGASSLPAGQLQVVSNNASNPVIIGQEHASQTANVIETRTAGAAVQCAFGPGPLLKLLADETTDVAPNDDTTIKKLTIQRLGSDPTNAAFIKFSNSPGTPTNDFYLVLEEA